MKTSLYLLGFFLAFSIPAVSQDNFQQHRQQMVNQQLTNRGIKDKSTLDAMRTVERHKLVPQSQQRHAYEDRPLPIGHGQTISQPYIVAYMTEIINPHRGMKVLEIGTGSGYQAAVLAEIVDEVYSIEIVDALAGSAKTNLNKMGYSNVHIKAADGYHGWEEHGPFDAIVVTAASEFIPPPLIAQLKEGGKMIIPVGAPFTTQRLMLVEKEKDGKWKTRNLFPVRFVPFTRN